MISETESVCCSVQGLLALFAEDDRCEIASRLAAVGRCNRREFDRCLSETVFDDLGHPIAAPRIDGGATQHRSWSHSNRPLRQPCPHAMSPEIHDNSVYCNTARCSSDLLPEQIHLQCSQLRFQLLLQLLRENGQRLACRSGSRKNSETQQSRSLCERFFGHARRVDGRIDFPHAWMAALRPGQN